MELKSGILAGAGSMLGGLNRTFMELKSQIVSLRTFPYKCLNRTFMELKLLQTMISCGLSTS